MKVITRGQFGGWFTFLFGYEPWGKLRPEWIILKNGHTYFSWFGGIFIRCNYFKKKIPIINKLREGFIDTDKFTKPFLFEMIKEMENTMKKKKITCCFMNGKKQCGKPAEFEIRENTRTDPDNYTFSCEKHLGAMMGTTVGFPHCTDWTISEITIDR